MCPPQTACVPEERSNARKHPPKKKNARLGRFEGKVGKANFGTQQGSFQAFSMGRKSSRRKQRGCDSPLRLTSDGNADRRTAWLRRFPKVCSGVAIGGCRCTCFTLWFKNRVAKTGKARNKGVSGSKIRRCRLV